MICLALYFSSYFNCFQEIEDANAQPQTLDDIDDETSPIEPLPSDLDYLQDLSFLKELTTQDFAGSLSSSDKSHRSLSTDHGYDSNTDHTNGIVMSNTKRVIEGKNI